MQPFVLPWDDATPGPTNLATPQPAGANGPITISADGHLYDGKERIRFVGVNLAQWGPFLTHAQADAVSARMAKFGINAVRLHNMDFRPAPQGIFKAGGGTRTLDPQNFDRVLYLVSKLAEHGIYTDVNLLVGRTFTVADGLPQDVAALNSHAQHGIATFYPPLLELQREYARQLLGTKNPYRHNLTLAQDPAVAIVETINETGLLNSWFWGELNFPPYPIRQELSSRWNKWLHQHYKDTDALAKAWGTVDEPLGAEMLPADGTWAIKVDHGDPGELSTEKDDAGDTVITDRCAMKFK